MAGLWRSVKRAMIGVVLLWMTFDVQASNPAGRIEEALSRKSPDQIGDEHAALQQEVAALRKQNGKLRRKAQGLLPEDPYIVVDTK